MSTAEAPTISHGRGGAGNVAPDSTEYVDGAIVRESDPASSGAAYSTGRGGASNIAKSPKITPVKTNDDDIIPEIAKVVTRPDEPFHTGRGGEGNAVNPAPEKKPKITLAHRIKEKLLKVIRKKKKEAAPPAAATPAAAPAETVEAAAPPAETVETAAPTETAAPAEAVPAETAAPVEAAPAETAPTAEAAPAESVPAAEPTPTNA